MSKERDMVGELLPTLCKMFMAQRRDYVTPFALNPAEDSRELFDAIEALQREQKIRSYSSVLNRSAELRDAMKRAIEQKRWKQAQNLAASMVVELTALPILQLVVLVQESHLELVKGIDQGLAGFEAFERFATTAQGIVQIALDEEKTIARHKGRGTDRSEPAVMKAARDLFDNRLGWERGNPHAPREFWATLGEALYGSDDPRVIELRAHRPE